MGNNDELVEEGKDSEETLLDFEFDDLFEEDANENDTDSPADDDIIELVDIIEKGDMVENLADEEEGTAEPAEVDELVLTLDDLDQGPGEKTAQDIELDFELVPEDLESLEAEITKPEDMAEDLGTDELAELADKKESPVEPTDEEELDLVLEDQDLEEEKIFQDLESGLESASEDLDSSLELLSKDLEELSDAELLEEPEVEPEALAGSGTIAGEGELEKLEQDVPSKLPSEELGEMLTDLEEKLETERTASPPASEQVIGLSEEKFEKIITGVLGNIVPQIVQGSVEKLTDQVIERAEEKIDAGITGVLGNIIPQIEGSAEKLAGEALEQFEERIESKITGMVQNVVGEVVQEPVEKAAREVMAIVAEKVITEAIDVLKQSLEAEAPSD